MKDGLCEIKRSGEYSYRAGLAANRPKEKLQMEITVTVIQHKSPALLYSHNLPKARLMANNLILPIRGGPRKCKFEEVAFGFSDKGYKWNNETQSWVQIQNGE